MIDWPIFWFLILVVTEIIVKKPDHRFSPEVSEAMSRTKEPTKEKSEEQAVEVQKSSMKHSVTLKSAKNKHPKPSVQWSIYIAYFLWL